jgi:hypothetical protein
LVAHTQEKTEIQLAETSDKAGDMTKKSLILETNLRRNDK